MNRQLALIGAAAVIGLSTIVAKVAYEEGAHPGQLAAARFAIAGFLFAALAPLFLGRGPSPATASPWRAALTAGVFMYVGTWLEFAALERLPAAVVIVILASAPIWAALWRWAIWRTPVSSRQWAAAVAVITGVALISSPTSDGLDAVGCLLAMVDAMLAGGFYVVVERLAPRLSPRYSIPAAVIVAGVLAALVSGPELVQGLGEPNLSPWLLLITAGAVVWTLLVGIGMEVTDSVSAGTVLAAEPVFVAVAAYVVLDEGLSAAAIAGGSLTMIGVGLAVRGAQSSRRARSAMPGPSRP